MCVVAGCTRTVAFEGDVPIAVVAQPLPARAAVVRADASAVVAQPLPARAAVVRGDAIVVVEKIEFGTDEAVAPASFRILDEVAALSERNPAIKTIVIESDELSPPRTESVLAYLAERGVPDDVEVLP